MSKIAFMTLLNRGNSKLSPHFGKAKWLMVKDRESGASEFVQNTGLNGRAVVNILVAHGCTDVVFSEIGPGALARLQAESIRGWFAPSDVPVPELVDSSIETL